MSRPHALLSASGAHRWMNCPPSARLSEQYADKGSEYAAQGTDAHALAEYRLRQMLGADDLDDPRPTLPYYDEEMEAAAEQYALFVMELLADARKDCKDPRVMVEQRLDYSRWVENGFGTADAIVIGANVINVCDFKFGQGVQVDAEENPQMMLYALGALEIFDDLYQIDNVTMSIIQPRRDHVSTWSLPKADLLQWADDKLRPAARLAYSGEGDFHSGAWCMFCKAKHECRARAEEQMNLMRYDFQLPPTLTDEDVEEILGHIDRLVSWAEDIKDYALKAAVGGKRWNSFKLVEGRSNRRYTDEDAVSAAVKAAGYDPCDHRLKGITAMTGMLGRKRFDELLGGLIEKPQGKPTLVPLSDKRPALEYTDFEQNEGE